MVYHCPLIFIFLLLVKMKFSRKFQLFFSLHKNITMDIDYICRTQMLSADPEIIQSSDKLDGGMFGDRNNWEYY